MARLMERRPLIVRTQAPSVTPQSLLGQSRGAKTAHSTPALVAKIPGVADRKAGSKVVLR